MKFKRILIVDDSVVTRELLKKNLAVYGDCEAVENGIDALKAFRAAHNESRPFDLMTLDIDMPEMDGKDVLATIRGWEKAAGVSEQDRLKVIMVTAMDNERRDVLISFKMGCERYIVKPINFGVLKSAVVELGI